MAIMLLWLKCWVWSEFTSDPFCEDVKLDMAIIKFCAWEDKMLFLLGVLLKAEIL